MHNDLAKRRQLIWLSTASTLLIIMLWIFYMERTFSPTPKDTAAAQTDSVSILENGLSRIGDTVMTGLVNSYLYFHTVASQEKTFTITK
jgi:hypothetical protein